MAGKEVLLRLPLLLFPLVGVVVVDILLPYPANHQEVLEVLEVEDMFIISYQLLLLAGQEIHPAQVHPKEITVAQQRGLRGHLAAAVGAAVRVQLDQTLLIQ